MGESTVNEDGSSHSLHELLSAGTVNDWDRLVTHFSKSATGARHRQTMRRDSLRPAKLFETQDSNGEWRVCARSEMQRLLSPEGFSQTNEEPRGLVHLLVSRHLESMTEREVPPSTKSYKFLYLQEQ